MAKKFKESAKEKRWYTKWLCFTLFFGPPPPFFGESARGPVFGGVRKKAAHLFGLFEKKTFKLTTPVIGAVSAHVCQIINNFFYSRTVPKDSFLFLPKKD
jgi:hypothetical protein